jgi:FSR family fosmidomycin resistance protein-like MFS transporter
MNPTVTKEEAPSAQLPDLHDLVMLVLLFGIALRSSVWNIFQTIAMGNTEGLVWMAVAAFVGKIIGPMITKRVDPFLYVRWVLPLSTLVLICQDRFDGLLYLGLALLQSATGPMLKLMYSAMPNRPAFASGLTFGTGILIGGLIYYLDIGALILSGYLITLFVLFMCYAIWSTLKPQKL